MVRTKKENVGIRANGMRELTNEVNTRSAVVHAHKERESREWTKTLKEIKLWLDVWSGEYFEY